MSWLKKKMFFLVKPLLNKNSDFFLFYYYSMLSEEEKRKIWRYSGVERKFFRKISFKEHKKIMISRHYHKRAPFDE